MQLGIVANSNAEYHKGPGISISGLKELAVSPLHFWSKYLDPDREPQRPTEALILGTAIHCLILEPAAFRERFAVYDLNRRSKIGREFLDEVEAEGRTPLTPEQMHIVQCSANSLMSHPVMRHLLNMGGIVEESLYWRETVVVDGRTGEVVEVVCKMRPDFRIDPCDAFPNGLMLDVKSAADASLHGFSRSSYDLLYHMQAAWYPDGYQRLFGTASPPPFLFAAVEKEKPFARRIYSASEKQILLGRRKNNQLLNLYARCVHTNKWPGYPESIDPLPLPPWGDKELQDLIAGDQSA